ncbi:NUDIX hydrolase domain-like protein [Phakopsora pachyrhizi]|uniref:NUDIX hydrolase domain-like protein n=1 Tax=Phakopsora pachyrhizi TaxID=170000 RepID=A0AAV0AKQ9_PHAPC|nr:NUDIX hydrolase domain-like protein [Phakopsora pachyrhizi]CAH7668235.1 NUDIX hydrolase domain-like protein [Phakopsora pachyrhizi]
MSNSFLSVINRLNNFRLPIINNSSITWDDAVTCSRVISPSPGLVPFFIHAPDRTSSFTALRNLQRQTLTPVKPRRTSSSSSSSSARSKRLAMRPLSSYLTRRSSSENLGGNPDYFQDAQPSSRPYGDEDRQRDFSQPIGFISLDRVLRLILRDNQKMVDMNCKPCWKVLYHLNQKTDQNPIVDDDVEIQVEEQVWGLSFEDWINESSDPASLRTEHFDRLVRTWKEAGLFSEILDGWRDEAYPIYGPKSKDHSLPGSNVAFKIERAASALFGFLTFGAHLTAYINVDGEKFVWTPRRSATKSTYPSKLDNTAAGGIQAGESPIESIIRESAEEASLDEDYVRQNIRSIGLISYVHKNQYGWVQPEIQYTYELELPSDNSVIPKPNDGESQDFKLLSMDEIRTLLKPNKALEEEEEFKLNSGVVLIDFMVKHGIINANNETNFIELYWKLNQFIGLPLP